MFLNYATTTMVALVRNNEDECNFHETSFYRLLSLVLPIVRE
jgi:hypothetical protein